MSRRFGRQQKRKLKLELDIKSKDCQLIQNQLRKVNLELTNVYRGQIPVHLKSDRCAISILDDSIFNRVSDFNSYKEAKIMHIEIDFAPLILEMRLTQNDLENMAYNANSYAHKFAEQIKPEIAKQIEQLGIRFLDRKLKGGE